MKRSLFFIMRKVALSAAADRHMYVTESNGLTSGWPIRRGEGTTTANMLLMPVY